MPYLINHLYITFTLIAPMYEFHVYDNVETYNARRGYPHTDHPDYHMFETNIYAILTNGSKLCVFLDVDSPIDKIRIDGFGLSIIHDRDYSRYCDLNEYEICHNNDTYYNPKNNFIGFLKHFPNRFTSQIVSCFHGIKPKRSIKIKYKWLFDTFNRRINLIIAE